MNAGTAAPRSLTTSYLAREVVLVHENVLQTPHLEAVDVTQLALSVEVLPTVFTIVDELFRQFAEQLHALRQMVFVSVVIFSGPASRKIVRASTLRDNDVRLPNAGLFEQLLRVG